MADHGIEKVSVREVASAAGVAIGTVQYHFPNRTTLLSGAFAEVVRRTSERLSGARPTGDTALDLANVLTQLLPVDEPRVTEAKVMVGFAAAAVHDPHLAAIQRDLLTEVRAELAAGFRRLLGDAPALVRPADLAMISLALVDGLALHHVSTGGTVSPDALKQAISTLLDLAAQRAAVS